MKKKKLLFAITKSSWGGAQKYVFDLAVAFKDEYDVQVVCGENEFKGENIFTDKLQSEGIVVHQITSLKRDISFLNEFKVAFQLYKIIKEVKPDIIHLNSSKMAITGSFVSFLARVPNRIYTAHGYPFIDTSRSALKNFFIKYITRFGLLFVHKIINISKRELQITKAWPEARKKAYLVYNGFVPGNYLAKDEAKARILSTAPDTIKTKIEKGSIVLGNIAELRKNKGTHVLLQALSQLKNQLDFVYIHIGTGEEEVTLKKMVKELGLENHVYFAGFINSASEYLEAFDIFVLPSLQEGTPYVLVEAGYAKRCVIATNVGAVNEMVTNEVSDLLVSPNDVSELSSAIAKVINNTNKCQQFAANLYDHISIQHDFNSMLNKTNALY